MQNTEIAGLELAQLSFTALLIRIGPGIDTVWSSVFPKIRRFGPLEKNAQERGSEESRSRLYSQIKGLKDGDFYTGKVTCVSRAEIGCG